MLEEKIAKLLNDIEEYVLNETDLDIYEINSQHKKELINLFISKNDLTYTFSVLASPGIGFCFKEGDILSLGDRKQTKDMHILVLHIKCGNEEMKKLLYLDEYIPESLEAGKNYLIDKFLWRN